MSVLLVTKSFPPVIGGSAFLLYELLKDWTKEELAVVHGVNDPPIFSDLNIDVPRKMVTLFNSPLQTLRMQRRAPNIMIYFIKREIIKMARKTKPSRIYAHFPSPEYVVAAYLAAVKLKLPLTIYYDILWETAKPKGLELSRKYEQAINDYADTHFAITEFAVDYLTKKNGKPFQLIPHTVRKQFIPSGFKEVDNAVKKVHFAGGIYPQMNSDAVYRFHKALQKTGLPYQFEVCTKELPSELKEDENVVKQFYSKEELIESQSNSDILLLPQAFESDKPTMITNNFPTKTMEYLCSGRPILVHSPEDSYLTWLAKKEGFAYVVDQPDEEALLNGIQQLLTDTELQKKLVSNAIRFAKERQSDKWSQFLKDQILN